MSQILNCRTEVAPARMAEKRELWNAESGQKATATLLPENRIIRIEQQLARARRRSDGEGGLRFVDENTTQVDGGGRIGVARFSIDRQRRDQPFGRVTLDDGAAEGDLPL